MRPVIVLDAANELEAQVARDVLASAMIPVVHIPSISTGIFAIPTRTRVAVPEEYVEQAQEVLRDAGLQPTAAPPPGGAAAVEDAVERHVGPVTRGLELPEGSRLRRVLIGLLVAIVGLVALQQFAC